MPTSSVPAAAVALPPADFNAQFALAKARVRRVASALPPEHKLAHAHAFCQAAATRCWQSRTTAAGVSWELTPPPITPETLLSSGGLELASELGELAALTEPGRAAYLLGGVYTALLPDDLRSQLGAYYTPPQLVSRLLVALEAAGVDWKAARVLDPACGSGAFLVPVAQRMTAAEPGETAAEQLDTICDQLRGVELDPFSAWLAQVFLEVALLPLCVASGRRLPRLVLAADALDLPWSADFDVVLGNPPYGRVSLSSERRTRFARSLHGHANLYGIFTDLALRVVRQGGFVGFVTPTSFLAGQYFKALRHVLTSQASPVSLDFVVPRAGVFEDVQQETLLAVYGAAPAVRSVVVSRLTGTGEDVEPLAAVSLPGTGAPWLLPRDPAHVGLVARLARMPTRLADLGFSVSTGPLVWNRHKAQLREVAGGPGVAPLIWAETVTDSGFQFVLERRRHAPYLEVTERQGHLLTTSPCVLVQRTTAKEQVRRLVAAVLPPEFIERHGAVVVENHLNLIIPGPEAVIAYRTLAVVLNSRAADAAFRCISGSVAVSAYELNALPLPNEKVLQELEQLMAQGASMLTIEAVLDEAYGLQARA